ncbi:Proteophosphoglycan ppg4 [Rhodotorula diobovata]|uniref:Proteophosphoglycan ppg4 n=1 Tax=Rhodotorula diobovata TaxID=5288 RepID=A0A5C5G296_9BASI|nr:Proteophosphoglycan ppg4 [Rhodotorula diobovata]
MLPDNWLNRLLLRAGIGALDAVAPLSLAWLVAAAYTYPASPAVAFTTSLPPDDAADLLLKLRLPLALVTAWCAAEVAWRIVSKVTAVGLERRWWDRRQDDDDDTAVGPEERWRLWRGMVESAADPWDWMGGAFLPQAYKRAPRGADDPAFDKVRPDQVGRTNVEEYISHLMFAKRRRDVKADPLARAELHAMILLLEAQFTLSRPGSPPFRFLRGRSSHRVFQLAEEPLNLHHHPLVFYAAIAFVSQLGYFALFCAGFRYYGSSASWPFPLFFMRSSRRALESHLDPLEASRMGDARLAGRVGYWMRPASKRAQEEDLKPIIFAHGISGTFVTVPCLITLSWISGRAVFLPEIPYVSMRLAPPSTIFTRLEYVAAARRMLWAHGFGLSNLEPDEDDSEYEEEQEVEQWRRAKAVLVAHSFGTGAAAWLLRDAPDIVAGSVLIDPMSFLLFSSDSPRNFFRTKCRTAAERFFRYFALERGINHFLSRHLRWSDSVIFTPTAAAPLPLRVIEALVPACARDPLEPPFDVPNYAPFVSPCPQGPLPSVVFLSEKDCILPVRKARAYLEAAGFSTGAPSPSLSRPLAAVEAGANEDVAASEPATPTKTNGATPALLADGSPSPSPSPPASPSRSAALVASASSSAAPTPPPPPPPTSLASSSFPSLHLLPAEHGAILTPLPILLRRVRLVAHAVDEVERAAWAWEHEED